MPRLLKRHKLRFFSNKHNNSSSNNNNSNKLNLKRVVK